MNGDMVNIFLISPSSMPLYQQEVVLEKKDNEIIPRFETPTGLIELASYIRNKHDDVNFSLLDCALDLFLVHENRDQRESVSVDQFYNDELDKIEEIPDIVGISVLFSSAYNGALRFVEIIKKRWPETIVVLGGGHVTFYAHTVFVDSPFVDYVFVGESEISFSKFVEFYRSNGVGTSDVKGVYGRSSIICNNNVDFGDLLVELDDIGLPAYDLLNIEMYKKYSNAFKEGAIGVMMDRGCPFKCTYCASMIIHGSGIRSKSNSRIISDLLYIRDQLGFKNVVLWDDLLAARKKKFIALAKEIVEQEVNQGLLFSMPSGLSVRIMNYELIDAICSLGFDYVRIMIESGSKYSQEHLIKKKVDLDKARDLIAYARTKRVKVETNILFGFPGESKDYMQETIDYIKTIDVDWIQVFAALPLPGTDMFYQFVEEGVVDAESIDWDRCGYGSRDFDTKEVSAKELTDLVYDVNIYTNFFGNRNVLKGRYERAIRYFSDMVLQNYPFHTVALYMRAYAYGKLGDDKRAEEDLREAVKQIHTSPNAYALLKRYGSIMRELHHYLTDDMKESILPAPPSIEAGFSL